MQNMLEEATDCYQEGAAKMQSLFGQDNPFLAMLYDGLGNIYEQKGQREQAEDFYFKAKSIAKKYNK